MELDLDAHLHFVKSALALTNQRILTRSPDNNTWQSWAFAAASGTKTSRSRRGGAFRTDNPHGATGALALYLGQKPAGDAFKRCLERQINTHLSGELPAEDDKDLCPSCKAPLDPDEDTCPVCTKVIHTPPSTWTLFRLWRFAKPYRGQLLLGFVLLPCSRHRRQPDSPLSDHAVDGQCPHPFPERQKHRPDAGDAVYVWPFGICTSSWPYLGQKPMYWRWYPNALAPIYANSPPMNTCCAYRWSISAANVLAI